jgi:glycosyltransferase involved in cell wall biosynthesis
MSMIDDAGSRGEDLVFLISMPRSGSTVLSMMLGSHSQVLCPPEPWILLQGAQVLGLGNLDAIPFGQESALLASVQFLQAIVDAGHGQWLDEVLARATIRMQGGGNARDCLGDTALTLYEKRLDLAGKRMFLDKTPRYYRILDLLDELYPRARKIYLKRNPLDVASSYKDWGISVEQCCGTPATAMTYDFCHGMFRLQDYFERNPENAYQLAYEDLITAPEATLTSLCRFLGVAFEPAMLAYFRNEELLTEYSKAVVGDPRASKRPAPVDSRSLNGWRSRLTRNEKQQIMSLLGCDIVRRLGYDAILPDLAEAGIELPAEGAARARRESLAAALTAAADQDAPTGRLSGLLRSVRSIHGERHAQAETIGRLLADNGELDNDRRTKQAVIDRLVAEQETTREDNAACRERLGRLADECEELRQRCRELDHSLATVHDKALCRSVALRAKDAVIREMSAEIVARAQLGRGFLDLPYRAHRGRYPNPSFVGRYQPPGCAGADLRHVAIDAVGIIFGVSGGVETYMTMLVNALLASATNRVTILCTEDQLGVLRARYGGTVGYLVFDAAPAVRWAAAAKRKILRLQDQRLQGLALVSFAWLRDGLGVDILHSPLQIFSAMDFGLPSVVNLHDLQHLHFPEYFRPSDIEARNHLYGLAAGLADAVIASSDFVRDDIVERMQVAPRKVFVVPVTWNVAVEAGLASFSVEAARQHYHLPDTYAIFPAQFWLHKNHARLVEALRIVRERLPGHDLKLVFTGYRGHSGWPAVQEAMTRHGMGDHVLCLDHVPVEHLAALYRGAVFCVMPSTFEASSYPVIEAQVLGCPAMCSNVTSLPELMRDGAGLLFNPFDAVDIAEQMVRWLVDPTDRAEHARRGMARARRENSLERYIERLDGIYDHVLSE